MAPDQRQGALCDHVSTLEIAAELVPHTRVADDFCAALELRLANTANLRLGIAYESHNLKAPQLQKELHYRFACEQSDLCQRFHTQAGTFAVDITLQLKVADFSNGRGQSLVQEKPVLSKKASVWLVSKEMTSIVYASRTAALLSISAYAKDSSYLLELRVEDPTICHAPASLDHCTLTLGVQLHPMH